ncbi:MAG: phosphoribosyltransferase family protein [Lacisediminihabitans sp.]
MHSSVRAVVDSLPGTLSGAALDALAVLFPIDCAGCGASDRALCPSCTATLTPQHERRLLANGTEVFTALRYEGVVRRIILSFKEHGRTDLAGALGAPLALVLAEVLTRQAGNGIELCTIPPGRASFRRRGYDPVALMLRKAGLPATRGVLVSVRRHAQQKVLDRGERQRNLVGTLATRHSLAGRLFVLIDDVVTTGATLVEAARAIRAGGGEVLFAVALANTVRRADEFGSSRRKLVTYPEDGATVSERGAGSISWFHWGVTRHGN